VEPLGYCLFPTAIGVCGIVWSRRGIVRLDLPDAKPGATRSRLRRRYPGCPEQEPPQDVAAIVAAVGDHLEHGDSDLASFPIDLDGVTGFERRVYMETRRIPVGSTRTYGHIARAIGVPDGSQAVGRALAANPIALLVPCHRVVAAGGEIGGFSAGGGATTKRRILRIEGSEYGASQGTLFDT
jgi:methylated-DNA-[protein]-cysteine S-methyltransferase